ncbi:MAG: type II CAAX prenyl endopeptidase Rce1 family protein [Halopenitus sp.]
MADWTAFAVAVAVLTLLLLFLTHRSQQLLEEVTVVDDRETLTEQVDVGGAEPTHFDEPGAVDREFEAGAPDSETAERGSVAGEHESLAGEQEPSVAEEGPAVGEQEPGVDEQDSAVGEPEDQHAGAPPGEFLTTRLLLVNVLFSQGIFLAALAGLAWWTEVPASAFGLTLATLDASAVAVGLVAGVVLYAGNEVAARLGERFGFAAPEALRSAMAPTDRAEWALLLLAVLPTIAVFEELLFRGALVGVLSVGFGIDPWLLVVASSAVFGLGHGAQGRLGILVTAGLGLVLGAVFVMTGNLFVVILAHYVINALEFVVQEGFA